MNLTITRLAWQAICGRRRFWAMLVIPVLVVGLATLIRVVTGEADPPLASVHVLGLVTSLPLVALLVTTSVLGPEIDDGSVMYLLSKPISRPVVAISKYLAAWAATVVFGALPLMVAGFIADPAHPQNSLGFFVAGIVVAATYCALFLMLSTLTRHAVVLGLLYVFMWEAAMSSLLTGIRYISVRAWGNTVLNAIDTEPTPRDSLSLTYALIACVVVIALGLFVAGQRLRSLSLKGEE
jgi:ABC-2 type transport system permease protein